MRQAAMRCRRVRGRAAADPAAGFSLLEVVVAIGLIAVVMAAALPLFIKSMKATNGQGMRQDAVAVADQALEQMRSVPINVLLRDRTAAANNSLWASAAPVSTAGSFKTADPAPRSVPSPAVPTTRVVQVGGQSYTVRTFIDGCYLRSDGSTCAATSAAGASLMYRISVDVIYTSGAEKCTGAGGLCHYVVTTLRDPSTDAMFTTAPTP